MVAEPDGRQHAALTENDEERGKALEGAGAHVLRFTDEEVCNDLESVLQRIPVELRLPLERAAALTPGPSPARERGGVSMTPYRHLLDAIAAEGSAALIRIVATAGSTPREAGAAMVVRPSGGFHGSIGGGALEWLALAEARAALARGRGAEVERRVALGPELAQCCGGRVDLAIDVFDARDIDELARREREGVDTRRPILLFGAGHVGRALTLALAPLPFRVRWIDSRPEAFPRRVPQNCELVQAENPVAELDSSPAGAFVVVMTHSHPLDLAIVSRALGENRFGYVGLIGSATKRARFESFMRAAGVSDSQLATLVCPIGIPGISSKLPAAIATSVAAQLLQCVEPPGVVGS
ncbi:MAG: xanthine dehydrogenase accessory protein XdhC [Roseiarcus sp.]